MRLGGLVGTKAWEWLAERLGSCCECLLIALLRGWSGMSVLEVIDDHMKWAQVELTELKEYVVSLSVCKMRRFSGD